MHPEFSAEAEALVAHMPSSVLSTLRTTGWKLRLRKEQRQGWSGSLPFYFFWCPECEHFAKDYPHGFIARQYLTCSHCGIHHEFVPIWAGIAEAWRDFKAMRRSHPGTARLANKETENR
ncbi:MAG TPA: hypothetical protein VLB83_01120 [Candidatus Paceibacterota bacterium]|nr:hypothetical protein [Candidatus Paceibacterota bacterium]